MIDETAVESQDVARAGAAAPGVAQRRLADGSTGVLDELAEPTRLEFERQVREVRLAAGTTVFAAADFGDALYLVRSGIVDVTTGRSDDRRLDTLAPST